MSMLAVTKATGVYQAYNNAVTKAVNDISKEVDRKDEKEVKETSAAKNAEPTPKTSVDKEAKFNDISDIVEAVMPSVVAISGTSEVTYSSWFGPTQTYEAESSGSGIIVGENDEEYFIVTNNHVVEGTKALSIKFIDDTTAEAIIKGTDPDFDIGIVAVKKADLKQETKDKILIATLGDSDKLKVGQGVVAIGNALGYGQSVTVGYISALNREVQVDQLTTKNLLQTDAAINPGNSGGALINMNGEVIGINSAKYSSTEVEGMGYAIPISTVLDIIENLSNRETREPVEEGKEGYLGIQGQNIDANTAQLYAMPEGVYIYKILEGGGAAASDLQERDIITRMDAQRIRNMEELKGQLAFYKAGETVTITVERLVDNQYKEMDISVTLVTKEVFEEAEKNAEE